MNLELDLTWRLPLARRWAYVRPRRVCRQGPVVPWWGLMLLAGPVPVAVALVLALVILWMQGK